MAEPEAIEPLKIDAELWSHRDLLERIVERRFHIIEEMSDVEIGWQVELKESETDSEIALNRLNKHLNRLSWFAILQKGNPFDLVIMPKLLGRDPGLSVAQMSAVWLVFTSFLTLAGAAWLQHLDPVLKLTDPDLLTQSLFWFALPIALVMGIGSEIRRRFALNAGVDLGHHIPLAVPFLMTPTVPIWPFGVIGFTSQRRMDLLSFRDRKSLAIVSMVAPLIMVLCGMAFTLLGYGLTSNTSPNFGEPPITVSPSFFPELILNLYVPADEIALRSSWLHPLGLAGIALNTMGWVLLLPLPGFPGDRLLSSLLNPGEMEEGGTQTWLFVGVLVAGMYIVLNGGFWPWLMLIALGAWRRFSPEASAIPFVLNEAKDFSDRSKNVFSIILVATLLLGFPGMMPVNELEDWDSGLDTSEWPTEVSFASGDSGSVEFPLHTLGVKSMDVEFQVTFSGRETMAHWAACGEYILDLVANCLFEDIGPLSNQTYVIEYEALSADLDSASPFTMHLHWFEGLEIQTHSVLFSPSNRPTPAVQQWAWDGDWDTPEYCIEFLLDEELEGNLTIDSPRFSFSGESKLALNSGENQTICIDGELGSAHALWPAFMGQVMEAPRLNAVMDDGTLYRWKMQIADQHLQMFAGSYPATELFHYPSMGAPVDVLLMLLELDDPIHCPISTSISPSMIYDNTDENGSWVWNLSEIPQGVYSPNDTRLENGTIILPEDGKLLMCRYGGISDYLHLQPYGLAELNPAPATISTYEGMVFLPNQSPIKNYENESVWIEVQQATFGGQSNMSLDSFWLQPGEEWYLESQALLEHVENGFQPYFWLETNSEHWILHFVSHCDSSEGCGL